MKFLGAFLRFVCFPRFLLYYWRFHFSSFIEDECMKRIAKTERWNGNKREKQRRQQREWLPLLEKTITVNEQQMKFIYAHKFSDCYGQHQWFLSLTFCFLPKRTGKNCIFHSFFLSFQLVVLNATLDSWFSPHIPMNNCISLSFRIRNKIRWKFCCDKSYYLLRFFSSSLFYINLARRAIINSRRIVFNDKQLANIFEWINLNESIHAPLPSYFVGPLFACRRQIFSLKIFGLHQNQLITFGAWTDLVLFFLFEIYKMFNFLLFFGKLVYACEFVCNHNVDFSYLSRKETKVCCWE